MIYKKIYFNTNDLYHYISSFCVFLLYNLKDIILNEIPHRLSSIRAIEHQMDLVPGVSILNQPTYRSNSNEIKKLQKKMKELMTKEFTRENVSSCVVLILLVPKKNET